MSGKVSETGAQGTTSPRRGNLLVCEDNDAIRITLQRTLMAGGYRVLTAAHPDEALRLAGDRPAIELLITDVKLPKMNGHELSARIRERSPGLSVLYISGYASDVLKAVRDSEPEPAFLQKPFAPSELLKKVAELLDTPDSPSGDSARTVIAASQNGDSVAAGLAPLASTSEAGIDIQNATGDSAAKPERRFRSEVDALWRRFAGVEIGSTLAHELKQPLTAIALHCDAALTTARSHAGPQPELQEDLREAASQAFRAGRIVNDLERVLLDYESDRRVTFINLLLVRACELVEPEAAENDIAINPLLGKDLPATSVDRMQMILALTSLLRVGMKSVKDIEGVPRRVNVSSSLRGANIEISVEVPGPGLTSQELHFGYRAVGAADDAGLELAICRRIVAGHGGILKDVGACAGFTCYRFTLPVETTGSNARAPETAVPEAGG